MPETPVTEQEVTRLEGEIAKVCGVLNAATGQLISLIARVLETAAWEGAGIVSPSHWVAWRCGVSPSRARALVSMATRLADLPATRAALQAGALSEDQAKVVCRHASAATDSEMAGFAQQATVSQLARTLGSYRREGDPVTTQPVEDIGGAPEEEVRTVSFGYDDDGTWRMSAHLPADQGALVEQALVERRDALFHSGESEEASAARVSWPDALVGVAKASLAGAAQSRPHRERHQLLVHLGVDDGPGAYVHGGPALPDSLRRLLGCDGSVKPVWERRGVALSVGRAQRIVPARTRIAVEERDRGCVAPGCDRRRWLQVHHLVHWEDGGATDTANLVCLCSAHHRAHHRGQLGIEGDADRPGGLVFTDHQGRVLGGCGRPDPPGDPPEQAAEQLGIPTGNWVHPTGERVDRRWVYFNEPARAGPG